MTELTEFYNKMYNKIFNSYGHPIKGYLVSAIPENILELQEILIKGDYKFDELIKCTSKMFQYHMSEFLPLMIPVLKSQIIKECPNSPKDMKSIPWTLSQEEPLLNMYAARLPYHSPPEMIASFIKVFQLITQEFPEEVFIPDFLGKLPHDRLSNNQGKVLIPKVYEKVKEICTKPK